MPFTLIKDNLNLDFIGNAKYFVAFSLLTVALSLWGLFTKGLNYGIDFTGGTVIQAKFSQTTPVGEVRDLMASIGAEGASVVALGQGEVEYLITTRSDAKEGSKPLTEQLVEKVGADKVTILKSDVVGPKVGTELKYAALRSLFYSILFIMIYIWFRFDLKFAPGATIAMVHDLILATGFFIFTGHEFTITSVAALLTIAGYSVNDTIVIYDRARELFKAGGDSLPVGPTINKAINVTLSRTLVTSLSTLFAVVALAVFTHGEIQDFAIAIIVGVVVGTYSTYYIAAPFTIYMEKMLKKQAARR